MKPSKRPATAARSASSHPTRHREAESGEVDQSFEVSSSGDHSNQCAGVQGVANTGNAQNQLDLVEFFSLADDFELDEVGSDLEVSPENSTECDQQVNQAASASG